MQPLVVLCGLLLASGPVSVVVPVRAATTTLLQVNSLNISVPATANLGTGITGSTLSGVLGAVIVNDTRLGGGPKTWVVTVSSTPFQTGAGGPTEMISNAAVAYWSGPAISSIGGGTVVPGQPTAAQAQSLDVSRTAFSKTSGVGLNEVEWQPTLRVAVPTGIVGGLYQATVTHSIA